MPDDDRLRRALDSALGCASVRRDEAGVETFQWFCLPAEGQQFTRAGQRAGIEPIAEAFVKTFKRDYDRLSS
jgi:hypothetical protein